MSHLLFLLALRYRNAQSALGHFQYMLQVIAIGQPMAQVQQIVTDQQCDEHNHTKNHRHNLIVGRQLHLDAILFQRGIHTELLVERGISLIVIPVSFQIAQRQEGYGRFITHIEQGIIVRIKTFVEPFQFGKTIHSHQLQCTRIIGGIFRVMGIQARQGTIRMHQCFLIISVQIRIIHPIRPLIGLLQQRVAHHLLHLHRIRIFFLMHTLTLTSISHREQQDQEHAQQALRAFRQTEIEPASFSQTTFDMETTHTEQGIGLAIFLNDTLAIHQAESASLILLQVIHILRVL